jgi:uncharacterized protein
MKRLLILLMLLFAFVFSPKAALGQQSRFRVLVFYSTSVEPDHVQFAHDALKYFTALAGKGKFAFDATTDWGNMNDAYLKPYQVVVWLNDSPTDAEHRHVFQRYMEAGGAWLGFHAAGYNDKDTNWPWFVDFLGGTVFYINSWPPLPATLVVDRTHAATVNLPEKYVSPPNEWYVWKPSPRLNKDVRVLAAVDSSNYPLGLKDVLEGGDLPVVWTNTRYKMVYMNMGHGDKVLTSATQNKLVEDTIDWLGTIPSRTEALPARGTEISPQATVVNPKTGKLYAVNTGNNTVTVIDGATRTASMVKVGAAPEAIDVNPLTNRIYVGNSGSGTVSVIDGTNNAVTSTVNVGDLPYVVAVNPTTNKIYVSRTFSDTMTVIDGKTNMTTTLKAGVQADAIAVNPVSNKLYLINYQGNDVKVMDGASDRTTSVPAGNHLWGIALNPRTNKIYLASIGGSKVTVLDGVANTVTSVNTGNMPCAIAVDSFSNRVYAVNYESDSVTVIDGAKNSVIAIIGVGKHPQAIAVNPVTHAIYVANTHSDTVSVIDGMTNTVAATVNTGKGPFAIAVDTVANKAYIKTMDENSVTTIDGKSLVATPAGSPEKQ